MELWILLLALLAAVAIGVVVRLRNANRRSSNSKETKNIYPLW